MMSLEINKIRFYSYYILLLAIPFSFLYTVYVSSILIILLGVNWLFDGSLKSKLYVIKTNNLVILFVSIYLIYLLVSLLSANREASLFVLEKKLSILILPLIISTININKKTQRDILAVFVVSCLIASFFSLGSVIYKNYMNNASWDIHFDSFYRDNLCDFLNIHPTYFAIYLLFSAIVLILYLKQIWSGATNLKRGMLITLCVYFIILSILLSSRMPLIAFFVVLIFIGFKFIKSSKVNLISLFLALIIISAIANYFYQYPIVSQRFKEIRETPWQPPRGIHHNSTNLRVGQLLCSFNILKENWFLGVGPGNMQAKLNECYSSNNYSDKLVVENQNPHNQYIQIWLELGLLGLILFAASLLIPAYKAWKQKKYLYLYFIVFVVVCCLTESILSVHKGILFYAFFNSIFAFHSLNESQKPDVY